MTHMYDCIVIGGGQAGLAAGYSLMKERLSFLILEASDQAAGSWPHYYESLTLFSPARYSSLPGFPFPGDPDRYPARDEVIAYLLAYREHFHLPVRTRTFVTDVRQENGMFVVSTASGESFLTRNLISATGSFSQPNVPEIPGMTRFQGAVLHSKQYRNPSPFENQRVIVVGAGNSAVQIAVELARTADVTIAARSPVRFVPQRILGKDIHFWVTVLGLDQSAWGKSCCDQRPLVCWIRGHIGTRWPIKNPINAPCLPILRKTEWCGGTARQKKWMPSSLQQVTRRIFRTFPPSAPWTITARPFTTMGSAQPWQDSISSGWNGNGLTPRPRCAGSAKMRNMWFGI